MGVDETKMYVGGCKMKQKCSLGISGWRGGGGAGVKLLYDSKTIKIILESVLVQLTGSGGIEQPATRAPEGLEPETGKIYGSAGYA